MPSPPTRRRTRCGQSSWPGQRARSSGTTSPTCSAGASPARSKRRAASHPKFATRLKWAESQIIRRGGPLLITARFIPGGRTVLTIASGITRQRHLRFAAWVLAAAVIWATFSAGLAYVVGRPFKDNHAAAFWVAFGTALTINLVIELIRHRRNRARRAEAVTP
ncbi:MAG: VTT domain-containing protein [Ilumatobacteraceae bacterium]